MANNIRESAFPPIVCELTRNPTLYIPYDNGGYAKEWTNEWKGVKKSEYRASKSARPVYMYGLDNKWYQDYEEFAAAYYQKWPDDLERNHRKYMAFETKRLLGKLKGKENDD